MRLKIFSLMIFLLFLSGCISSQSPDLIVEGISEEKICNNLIKDKKSAATCFNQFFSQELGKIKEERDEVPEDIIFSYSNVTEENIFIFNNHYHINKSGYGSPYYIDKNGRILMEHG